MTAGTRWQTVDRFIARENIKHFHLLLLSDVEPDQRLRVERLLVEEEDKLGRDLELLADIERHIAEGDRRINAQRVRVEAMQRSGHDGVHRAQAFLDGMIESHKISTNYRQLIAKEVQRNQLLDR